MIDIFSINMLDSFLAQEDDIFSFGNILYV